MPFALVYLLVCRLVRLIAASSNEQMNTEVELVVLRYQLMVLKRQVRPRLRRRDRLFHGRHQQGPSPSSVVILPCQPADAHSMAPGARGTYRRRSVGGRPPIPDVVGELILQMGRENPRWGCLRIRGELAKLGIRVSASAIRVLLRANGLGPGASARRSDVARVPEDAGLQRVLCIYAGHYNGRRPHRGLELKTPVPRPGPGRWPTEGVRFRRHDVLGGLIHEYDLAG